MVTGRRLGWQTTIADLALILFMVTAAAMADQPEGDAAPDASLPVEAEPLALYRAAEGAPPLDDWLAQQPRDARQHLTILARHAPGDVDAATQRALEFAALARAAGREPRVTIEPAHVTDVSAILSYDGRGNWHGDCIALSERDRRGSTCE